MIGSNSQRALLKDLVDIVRRNLRSADLITFLNANTLIISMNEIPTKVAEHILKEIGEIMTRLIRKNFKNFEADIRYKVQTLNTKLSHELQMQQLTYEFMD
jgi:PleD family two-component response regulator